jgi:hypothetical protein
VGPPPRSLLGLPPVRSRPLVRAQEGLRALRRFLRDSNRHNRPRRNRRRSRRRNRSRARHRRPSRSKCNRRQLSHDRNRRPAGRARALLLRRSLVNRRRAQGRPMLGRPPQVPYLCGIRRRRQHLNMASGRGWASDGKLNGPRAPRPLRLPSSFGFLPRSRRLPRPVRRMRRSLRQVRPLRAGSRLVRRRSRAQRLELSLGPVLELSPGVPSVRALQRRRVWRPQRLPRSVRRRLPANLARRRRDPYARASRPAVRPLSRAEHLFRQSLLLLDRKRACPLDRPLLLLDRKRACPLDRPLLPRGCRGRRCSLQLRSRSQYRARRGTH